MTKISTKKIKVLAITHSFPTRYNPIAAIFLLNQLEALKKYCDIKVIFPYLYSPRLKLFNPYYKYSKVPEKEVIKGIPIYHPKYPMFPRIPIVSKFLNFFLILEGFLSYLSSKKIVKNIAKKWDPDIIHIHGTLGEGLLGVMCKRIFRKPLLITVYGKDITALSNRTFSKSMTKFTLANCDGIICQSRFLENEVKSLGITNKLFYIIPMGAKKEKFRLRDKEKTRKILSMPLEKKIILFVGHLEPRKGPEYLIEAMKEVAKKDKDILCCIIGKGELEKKLRKMASDYNLEQYVKFLGLKTNDEVSLYMSACDIFVLPSLMEGLPVVLCEALLSGKPVVATSVAGTPELVTEEEGYLVRPRDAVSLAEKIMLALRKEWDVKKLLKRGCEFTTYNSAKKLVDVYLKFLTN